jgi:protein ImuA
MNALSKLPAANQNRPAAAAPAGINSIAISTLRDQIARLERTGGGLAGGPQGKLQRVALNVPALDRHLPWGGLPRAALHEVAGEGADREQGAAAAGFAALWLGRLQAAGPVLWIVRAVSREAVDLHAHGLAQQSLDPQRLILVAARRDDEALWAMEEGLKARSLGAVLGEIEKLDLTASRRLQLAAEASGVTAFVLRRWRLTERAARDAAQPIAAVTRWRVASLPVENGICWQVALTRCRGGKPGSWILEKRMGEKADGSDEFLAQPERHAPLSGDLAPVLGGRPLAAGARN